MDKIRKKFLSLLDKEELKKLRFVCLDFSGKIEPHLFRHLSVTFNSKTFSSVARTTNLAMIGRHVESFTFNMPHTKSTVLPPLIDTETGDELPIVYSPKTYTKEPLPPVERDAQFGSPQVAKMLAEQYPPLFHAASNVPAFIKAFCALPNLRHVKINCPRKEHPQTHRRNIVDYALISLRIALEQAPLNLLNAISIISLHEEGLLYLQPDSFASTPRSRKRWLSIKHLNMRLQNHDSCAVKKTSALKLLHVYLSNFSGLRTFRFQWQGEKGPFPLSLHNEPRLVPATTPGQTYSLPHLRPLNLPTLCRFTIQNCVIDASQIGEFTMRYRRQWREFDFEGIELRSGTWDDALAPMARWAESTKRRVPKAPKEPEGEEVPLLFCDDPLRPSRPIPQEEITKQLSFDFSSKAGMKPSPLRPAARKQNVPHGPSSHRPVTPPKQISQPSTANSSFNASVFDTCSQPTTAVTSFSSAHSVRDHRSSPKTPSSQLRSRQASNETYCTTATSHSRPSPDVHLFTPRTSTSDFAAIASPHYPEPARVSLEIHPCLRPRPSVKREDREEDVPELLMPRCYRRAPSHRSGAAKAIAKAKERLSDASGHFKKLVRLSAFDWQ